MKFVRGPVTFFDTAMCVLVRQTGACTVALQLPVALQLQPLIKTCQMVLSRLRIRKSMRQWWSRFPLLYEPTGREDVYRNDFTTYLGRMRLRIESIDPIDICTDFAPKKRLLVEFDDDFDDELWAFAYQSFCNEGGFVEDDEDEYGSNFSQAVGSEHARTIFNEFHPEGTIIMITNLYHYVMERHDTTLDIFFWQPRNPQSQRRLRNALTRWRDYLKRAGGARARRRGALFRAGGVQAMYVRCF